MSTQFKTRVFRVIACLLIFQMLLCGVNAMPVMANAQTGDSNSGNDEGTEADPIGSGLYNVSTALTAYVNAVVGVNGTAENNGVKSIESTNTVGNAGCYVGAGDKDLGFNPGIIASGTIGSVTTSYSAWAGGAINDGKTYQYLRYGYLLNDLGLDTTSASGVHIMRRVAGVGMMVGYAGSEFLPQIFGIGVKLLRWVNPFNFLLGKSSGTGSKDGAFRKAVGRAENGTLNDEVVMEDVPSNERHIDAFRNGDQNLQFKQADGLTLNEDTKPDESVASNAYKNLQDFITGIYDVLYNGTWAVTIPLLFALLIASLLLFRGGDKSRKVRNFVMRIIVLVVGLPMLGLTYSAVINTLSVKLETQTPSTRIVCGTYVDFGAWVDENRLGMTDEGIESHGTAASVDPAQGASGTASSDSVRDSRATAVRINYVSGISPSASFGVGNSSTQKNDMFYNMGSWNAKTGEYVKPGRNEQTDNTMGKVINMLQRYTSADFYDPATWNSAVYGWLSGLGDDKLGTKAATGKSNSNKNTVYSMFNNTDSIDDWLNRGKSSSSSDEASDSSKFFKETNPTWKSFTIFAHGVLDAPNGANKIDSNIKFSGGLNSGPSYNLTKMGGLSAISMYNYLMSSFESDQVRIYSTNKSVSDASKKSHFTVSNVGSGILKPLMTLSAFILCGALTVLALVIIVGMIFSSLKQSFTILASLPGYALGVLRSMGVVIMTALNMIAHALFCIFFMNVAGDLFLFLGTIAESAVRSTSAQTGGNYETVLLNSVFGKIGVNVPMASLLDSRLTIYIGVSFAIVMMIFAFWGIYHNRRQILYAHSVVWMNFSLLMLPRCFAHVFDDYIWENPTLYPWDVLRKDWKAWKEQFGDISSQLTPIPAFALEGGK